MNIVLPLFQSSLFDSTGQPIVQVDPPLLGQRIYWPMNKVQISEVNHEDK